MRGNDILAKDFVFHFACPEDTFLVGEFSVLAGRFLGDYFKGANLVVKFLEDVRSNNL